MIENSIHKFFSNMSKRIGSLISDDMKSIKKAVQQITQYIKISQIPANCFQSYTIMQYAYHAIWIFL